MINVTEILDYVTSIINFFIYVTDTVYCVCYDDGKDRRILINYGLFEHEDDCEEFIKTIKNNNLKPFSLKINRKRLNFSTVYGDLGYLEDILNYAYKLELIAGAQIYEEVDNMLLNNVMDGHKIISKIEGKYGFTDEELKRILGDVDFHRLCRYKAGNVADIDEK